MNKLISAFGFLLAVTSWATWAQPVTQADSAVLQPQIGRDEAGFKSCGVRAVVVVNSGSYLEAYDFSIGLMAGAFGGLMKAGKSKTSMKDFQAGRINKAPIMPPPSTFWIAKDREGSSLIPQKVFPAENKGFILGVADYIKTTEIIHALMSGGRMHFAVRYKSQPVDQVVAFSAKMTSDEVMPLFDCLAGIAQRSLEGLEDSKSPKE